MYAFSRISSGSDDPWQADAGNGVAIIGGTGALGHALAEHWTRAGVTVSVGSRDPAQANRIPGCRVGAYKDVVPQCRVIVLAVPFAGHADAVRILARLVHPGQVVVDTTVPMLRDANGRPRAAISASGSVAQRTQELMPPGVHVVSALHTVSAVTLMDPDHQLDEDVLISGDDDSSVDLVTRLINRIDGIRAVHAGPLEFSRVCEQLTPLIISVNRRYKVQAGIKLTGVHAGSRSGPPSTAPDAAMRSVNPARPRTRSSRDRGMTVWEVAELAWQVAEFAAPMIDPDVRTTIFTQLGAGEHTASIQLALQWLSAVHEPLPGPLADRLGRWLDCYTGDPDERRLRSLVQATS